MIDDGPSIKLYPCCGGNHRLLENLRVAIDCLGGRESIREVTAHVNPDLLHVLRYDWPHTVTEARFSATFSLAAMLTNGTCGLESYTSQFLSSPLLTSARRRVRIVADLAGPVSEIALDVTDLGGNVHRFEDNDLPGTPSRPLSMNRIELKYRSNASMAVPNDDAENFMRDVSSLGPSMKNPWDGWRNIVRASTIFAAS
jgi:2-methylcitrate dehydratase PrpD